MRHPLEVQLPRVFAAGLWLAVTVSSTAMVWAATSIVAADVTDRPPSAIAHQDVVSELAAAPPVATSAPATTVPAVASSTTMVPAGARSATTTTLRPQATQPTATTPPISPPVTTSATPLTGRPAAPPTTQAAARPTATYSTTGGVVRVSCSGFFIDLLSAIPNNGYSVKVAVNGPVNIEVHFLRAGQDVSVKAVCFGQPIRYYQQIPSRTGFAGF